MQNYTKKETDKDGTIYYYNNQYQFHRLDGPAVEWSDGHKEWWINDEEYSEKEFNNYLKMQEAKQMLGVKNEDNT